MIHSCAKSVRRLDLKTGENLNIFSSITEATDFLEIPRNSGWNISKVCNEVRFSAYGYGWEWDN